MSDVTESELRETINEILQGADLNRTSSRKIRKQLEEKYDTDFSKRKEEIDGIIMKIITEKQNASEEQSDDEEKEEEEEEEASEEEYESESEEEVPKKKPKMSGKEAKKSKRKKAADSSSDSDWENSRKSSKKNGKSKPKKENSYTKKLVLSSDLAELVGAKQMARSDVVKKMWEIVRERNLFDPSNKQFVLCDAQLKKIFGEDRIRMFGVMKYLKGHMSAQK